LICPNAKARGKRLGNPKLSETRLRAAVAKKERPVELVLQARDAFSRISANSAACSAGPVLLDSVGEALALKSEEIRDARRRGW